MEANEVQAVVDKSDTIRIRTTLGRCSEGLRVHVWAEGRVEDFVRSLGTGEKVDIQTLGRHWNAPVKRQDNGKKVEPSDAKMLVYQMEQNPGIIQMENNLSFRLDRPGQPLLEDAPPAYQPYPDEDENGRRRPARVGSNDRPVIMNLSFLRLCGVSDMDGVAFTIKGVWERGSIDALADKIDRTCNRFYREFLKPYRVIVTCSTQPIVGNSW